MARLKSDEHVRDAHRRRGRRGLIGGLWRLWYDTGEADYRTRRVVAGGPPRNYSTGDSYCARCLREAPRTLWDSSVPGAPSLPDPRVPKWDIVTDAQGADGSLCPECLARAEQEEWAKADVALAEER
jgi:hypothetical protein